MSPEDAALIRGNPVFSPNACHNGHMVEVWPHAVRLTDTDAVGQITDIKVQEIDDRTFQAISDAIERAEGDAFGELYAIRGIVLGEMSETVIDPDDVHLPPVDPSLYSGKPVYHPNAVVMGHGVEVWPRAVRLTDFDSTGNETRVTVHEIDEDIFEAIAEAVDQANLYGDDHIAQVGAIRSVIADLNLNSAGERFGAALGCRNRGGYDI